MKLRLRKADQKFLASFFANMSAGWAGALFVTPNFVNVFEFKGTLTLILDIVSAVVCAILSIITERKIK